LLSKAGNFDPVISGRSSLKRIAGDADLYGQLMFSEFILIDIGRGYGLNYELEDSSICWYHKKAQANLLFLVVAGGHYEVLGML